MKYIIQYKNSFYKEPYNGLTPYINKAYVYEEDKARALVGKQGLNPEDFTLIPVNSNKKLLILGDARHGKDTMIKMLAEKTGLAFAGSSYTACEIFLYDVLKKKYNLSYSSVQEAWEDRVNHRDVWYNEICAYNSEDKLRLVKGILKIADIYVGLRNHLEVEEAIKDNVFDYIIGVYNYRKPREDKSSNTADVFKYSDFVIMNNGTLEDLEDKVINILLNVVL